MCGIFSLLVGKNGTYNAADIQPVIKTLFRLVERRGKEAAGIALSHNDQITIHRASTPASEMVKCPNYKKVFASLKKNASYPLAAIGHSRLVTNGTQAIPGNNQPVKFDGAVCVHNGIVTNVDTLWAKHKDLTKTVDVDSAMLVALIQKYRKKGDSIDKALVKIFKEIYGETSISVLLDDANMMVHATNTGSLYYVQETDKNILFTASEGQMLKQLQEKHPGKYGPIKQLPAGRGMTICIDTLEINEFSIKSTSTKKSEEQAKIEKKAGRKKAYGIFDPIEDIKIRLDNIKRCKKCILPDTVPGLFLDEDGICNQCHSYQSIPPRGEDALEEYFDRFRSKDGSPDCVMAFSGGRDSSYGLHLLKTKYNMNPIVFSYDWGMVTDLARRNQARMCGKLGIEHLWVSADIGAKRRYVRKNVEAWMKRPDMGMIPIFMAGDKAFFFHANRIMKETGINLMIFCPNNLETTNFKSGFCGVKPPKNKKSLQDIGLAGKLQIAKYYAKQYLLNPGYINSSSGDVFLAYISYYFADQNYLYMFDYEDWDEHTIDDVLINEYQWETSPHIDSTWRIGDGTAPFYNYIYHTVGGFTENDTFRSNQIREGILSREDALKHVAVENLPRYQEIQEYCQLIGVNFNDIMSAIDSIPKRY